MARISRTFSLAIIGGLAGQREGCWVTVCAQAQAPSAFTAWWPLPGGKTGLSLVCLGTWGSGGWWAACTCLLSIFCAGNSLRVSPVFCWVYMSAPNSKIFLAGDTDVGKVLTF